LINLLPTTLYDFLRINLLFLIMIALNCFVYIQYVVAFMKKFKYNAINPLLAAALIKATSFA